MFYEKIMFMILKYENFRDIIDELNIEENDRMDYLSVSQTTIKNA